MQDDKTTQPDSAKTENHEAPKPITNQDETIVENQPLATDKEKAALQISPPVQETADTFGKKFTDKEEPMKNDEVITAQEQATETKATEKTTGNSGLQD